MENIKGWLSRSQVGSSPPLPSGPDEESPWLDGRTLLSHPNPSATRSDIMCEILVIWKWSDSTHTSSISMKIILGGSPASANVPVNKTVTHNKRTAEGTIFIVQWLKKRL